MFTVRLIRGIRGSVRFRAEGGFPERFLNLAARAGVNLWAIERGETDLTATVAAGDYRRLQEPARRAQIDLQALERTGAPFVLRRYRKRLGIPLGILLCLALIGYLSGFIWTVELSGNRTLPAETLLETLRAYGLGVGCRKQATGLNQLDELEQRILLERPELSWISLSLRGTTLYVEVREAEAKPPVIDTARPANIVADKAGQIVWMEVYEGEAAVAVGDAVAEGDLLVSGVLEGKEGDAMLRHAQARILARVGHTETVEIPYLQTVQTPTGEVIERNYLRILSFDLPLFLATPLEGTYTVEGETEQLRLFGWQLPLWRIERRYTEVTVASVTLDRAEAHRQAMAGLQSIVEARYAGRTVIETHWQGTDLGDRYRLEAEVICEETIGVEREIYR